MSRNRCGCDCKNPTTFQVCDGRELNVCCAYCPDGAPSAYAVHWECTRSGAGAELPALTFLWRKCEFVECVWSAQLMTDVSAANPCISGTTCRPCLNAYNVTCFPQLTSEFSGEPCSVQDCNPFNPVAVTYPTDENCGNIIAGNNYPPVYTDTNGVYRNLSALPFECCRDIPGAACDCYDADYGPCGGVYRDGWHDWYDLPAEPPDFQCSQFDASGCVPNRAWIFANCMSEVARLQITGSSTATLTVLTSDLPNTTNPDLIYECDNFECLGRSTFTLTNRADVPDSEAWPDNVCVTPAVGNYRTPCDSAQDACNCRDSGWSDGYITINSPICVPSVDGLGLPRNATLPSCVTAPSGPCGYFWNTVGSKDGTLGFLVYCAGSAPYNLKVYCSTDGFSTCTLVCDTTTTETGYCPDGEAFTWSCPSFGSCCTFTCDDCLGDYTGNLNVDITLSDGGTGSGVMSFASGYGCADIDISGSPNITETSVELYTSPTCQVLLTCNGKRCTGGSKSYCGGINSVDVTSCDPVEITSTRTSGLFNCGCLPGGTVIDIVISE